MGESTGWKGRGALLVAHCAGMVDLVALPVWVGSLIAWYGLDPLRGGALPTFFLASVVVSSLFFAPRFNRISGKVAAPAGFAIAALAFFGIYAGADDYVMMAGLHALAGVAVGCSLTFTHGTIGRSYRPHRIFAFAGMALSIFAIVFLGSMPKLLSVHGGPMLFAVLAGIMAVASIVTMLTFPLPERTTEDATAGFSRLDPAVWAVIVGISCMSLIQAMMFSFLERIGSDRGFGLEAVAGVLFTIGIVNLLPAPLAAWLERRLPARRVVLAGPVTQAAIVLVISQSLTFVPYAIAASIFAAVIIFTHTYAFGLLSRLDSSGRAAAATPAMMMMGAAIGPVLGGALVKAFGYSSLGYAAVVIAVLSFFCFSRVPQAAVKLEALASSA
ncbi:MFS transporter [Thauera aromatica]|uniref:Major facilitator superfamily protein n=1 Tax=Thauera aromatica K172 TaxID=44139 RepID=A0A2R4BIH3_THAAR|nr:MFS transporter [Thauera aromatica]AVR87121.1 major facilitator superfamily protein [Thauera aromatica K172]